jgi:transposase
VLECGRKYVQRMIFARKSRMPVRVQTQLLEHFVAGTTARTAAKVAGVQGRTAVVFFQRLRQLIASKRESFLLSNKMESDERYLEGQRKVLVVGLLMRGDKVYTAMIADAKAKTVIPITQESVSPDSIIYTNSFHACDVLDVSEFHYKCINPSKTVLSRGGYHINGLENFWNQSKRYLRRFNGIPKISFYYFLKECEWRFNESDHHALSKQLNDWYQSELHQP